MITYRPICKIRLFSEKEEAFAYAKEIKVINEKVNI